jgi:hypothetical protein
MKLYAIVRDGFPAGLRTSRELSDLNRNRDRVVEIRVSLLGLIWDHVVWSLGQALVRVRS